MPDTQERLRSALAGRYEIEREIGQGGMATVYLAHDLRHDREVAVKVLRPDLAAALGTERFLREIKIAANLTHPHILPLYDSGEAAGFLYYVMPYIEGETLRQRIEKEGELPVTEAVRIVCEVVDALAFAHSHGVVHRDIKPDNVMLSGRHAMVADFGVAKAVSEATGRQALTTAGVALGTPAYMAPEQATADPHVDHRADIYAVGAVAYELLTGRTPFTGATPQAMLAAHVTEQVEPVSKYRDHVSAELEAVVMRCLEKRPADRWQSAEEMLAQLEVLATPSGGMTPTDTRPVERTTSPGRRRATTVIGAVLAIAAIAAVFLWPRGWSYDGDPRKSLIVFPFENRTGDDDNEWLEEASMNLLALSLSHWEDLRVFDDERTASLMRRRDIASASDIDFDAAQAMAQDANVGTLVMGDIRREGNEIAIEAKVHDVETGARLATEIVRTAVDADPRSLLDSLADRILLISGAPPGQNPGVLAQTTTSVEAYRSYLRGSFFMQRIALDSARHYFERAVALDTAFALAYIGLRTVEGWLGAGGDSEKRRSFIARAEAHSTNLPPRWRSLIQYYTAYESGDFQRARRIAGGMIARDSSDTEAWYQLGEAQFHHFAGRFPHQDTLGDMGKALFAFERTLALDSGYVLAYFHIVDALGNCSSTRARFVCLTDSTVYGEPDDLEERFGADEVARLRQEAGDRQVEVGYAWVAEVPETPRPRVRLTNVLLQQKRYAEAERQAVRLREIGDTLQADFLRLTALFAQRRFAAAADVAAALLTDMPDELNPASIGGYNQAIEAMTTAGRVAPWDRFFNALPIEEQVVNSPVTGEQVRIPLSVMADAFRTLREEKLAEGTYADRAEARRAERWADAIIATAFTDTVMARIVMTLSCGHSYLFARDTTTLVEWIALLPDSVCPAMRGHLALARGDTAAARTLGNRVASQLPQDPKTWNAENAVVAYSWADLLASMGRARGALDVYAKLDSVNFTSKANWLVRSWAERAAIHQALGETQDAIRLYQQVLDVLRNADESTQPFVGRIEAALAAARGESGAWFDRP